MRADRVDVRLPRVDNFSNKRNIYMNATMINCNRPDQLIEEARNFAMSYCLIWKLKSLLVRGTCLSDQLRVLCVPI